jgi:CRP-like cAMP-binding protein
VLGKISLKNSLVVDTNSSEGQFQIVVPGEQVITFEVASLDKQSWIRDLQDAMYQLTDPKGKQMSLTLSNCFEVARTIFFTSKKMQDREWQLVTANSEEVVFSHDDIILSEGNANNGFVYRITEGSARVEVVLATGKLVTINRLREGTLFGEMSMIGISDTSAKVVADSDTIKLKKMEASFVAGILKTDTSLATKFWRYLAGTLHFRLRTLPSAYKLAGDIKNEGIARFNDGSPSKAIKYLIEEGFLKNTPDSIVKFLKETPELSKAKVGEFLGERRYAEASFSAL